MAKETAEKKKQKRSTALKRDDQALKRRMRNRTFKSQVRTAVRQFHETISKGDAEATKQSLSSVYSLMDKGVKKGIFKINKANRTKARLAAHSAKT